MKRLGAAILICMSLGISLWLSLVSATNRTGELDGWLAFDRFATIAGFAVLALAAFGLLLAWWSGWLVYLRRRRYRFNGPDDETVATEIDALLLLIGPRREGTTNPAELTVDLCKPKRIAALYTHDSADEFKRLRGLWLDRGIRTVDDREIQGPDDFAGARRAAAALLTTLLTTCKDDHSKVAADITGTTKPIGIGAFVAAEEAGVATIYLLSNRDPKRGTPISGSERLVFLSKPNHPQAR